MNYDELKEYAAASLKFDWMSLLDFVVAAQDGLNDDVDPAEVLRIAGANAARLVRDGLIVPGDTKAGFHPWPTSREESAARIEAEAGEAAVSGAELYPGDIAWFASPDQTAP
ncbi:hypothetical protein GCM10022247_18840 [Allokutzneria multivorans]|uniref:Uncharacterized protein n=1 Tax=Allokutzneria multivorans TaxID=1142134 RepID=A0ABP7RKJ0_9PSEU